MVIKSRKKGGRGHAISKVKRQNQRRTKLVKQGKLKLKRNKRATDIRRNPNKRHAPARPEPVEEEESDGGEDMAGMVDTDDLDFLRQAVTQRSYSMLKRLRYKPAALEKEEEEEAPVTKQRRGGASKQKPDEGNLEEQFERLLDVTRDEQKPVRELLPIKTKDGAIQRRTMPLPPEPELPIKEEIKTEEPDEELEEESEEEEAPPRLELPAGPVSTAQLLAARKRQLARYRISIGALASGVLEEPEAKIGNLKKLLALISEPQPSEVALTVPRLAAVSLLEVFRDLLPEYPVRHQDPSAGLKLSKDVKELRMGESALLSAYKQYLGLLEKMLQPLLLKNPKGRSTEREQQERLALVALRCMGGMLESRPSFNFAMNLVRLLVLMLDHRYCPQAREIAATSLGAVLKEDRRGDITLEIARRVNALVKAREGTVRPEPVRLLLNLRLRDVNLDAERESSKKVKKLEARKFRMIAESKRERKRAKKMKGIEMELLETKAEESRQTRQKNFTEATKLAFTVFFRALKSDTPRPALLAATLEGLAKFAHCINVEVYSDLVKVLEALLNPGEGEPDLPLRLKLLCVKTLLSVLSGHGQFLTIDPARFHAQLYRCLLPICTGSNAGVLREALAPLAAVLGAGRRKSISQQRLLAFVKRLGTLALNVEHHGALAALQLVRGALQVNRETDILLDTDRSGGRGIYLPELEEPEHCNAGSTALYELAVLQRHYHPTTRSLARYVSEGAPATGNTHLPPQLDKLSAELMYLEFEPSEVKFNPVVPAPKQKPKQRIHFSAQGMSNPQLRDLAENVLESEVKASPCDFWTACVGRKKGVNS